MAPDVAFSRRGIKARRGISEGISVSSHHKGASLAAVPGTSRHAGRPGRSRRAGRPGHCVASVDLIGAARAASEDLVGAARVLELYVPPLARNLRGSVTSAQRHLRPPASCSSWPASNEGTHATSLVLRFACVHHSTTLTGLHQRSSLGYEDPCILFLKSLPTSLLFRRLRSRWLPH
jgi:hypothetical protein